jgi:hypothetical protein
MENPIIKRMQVTDSKLKKLFAYYIYAAAVFIIVLLLGLITGEYARSLDETLNSLEKLRSGLFRVSDFTGDMKKTIAASGSVIPSNYFVDAPEKSLLISLDALKATMPNAELIVSGFAAKEGEVNLPVTMKGPIDDYSTFINNIGKLQAMKFPFFSINSLVMKRPTVTAPEKKGEQQRIAYEMTGELRMPKEMQTAGTSVPPGKIPPGKSAGR